MVYALDPSTVIKFDVNQITAETAVWAVATDWRHRLVYDTRWAPNKWFNKIYPGMPLNGWWPWLKAPASEANHRKPTDVENERNTDGEYISTSEANEMLTEDWLYLLSTDGCYKTPHSMPSGEGA